MIVGDYDHVDDCDYDYVDDHDHDHVVVDDYDHDYVVVDDYDYDHVAVDDYDYDHVCANDYVLSTVIHASPWCISQWGGLNNLALFLRQIGQKRVTGHVVEACGKVSGRIPI